MRKELQDMSKWFAGAAAVRRTLGKAPDGPTPMQKHHYFLLLAGLAAASAGIVINGRLLCPAPSARRAAAAPSVILEPAALHLGDMIAGERARSHATIRNVGCRPAEILGAATSCACTTSGVGPLVLPPGASAPLAVAFDSSFRRGNVEEVVMVTYRDGPAGRPLEADLDLDAQVRRLDWAEPGAVDFGTVAPGSTVVRPLVVRSTRAVVWRPRLEDSDGSGIEVRGVSRPTELTCHLELVLRAKGLPGPADKTVRIALGSPLPPLAVPITYALADRFTTRPGGVNFGLVQRDRPVCRSFSVRQGPGRCGWPTGVASAPDWLQVSSAAAGHGLDVTATTRPAALPRHAALTGFIEVRTTDELEPLLRVPVELLNE
jgi:hypothetical protein